jgi:hypothetical protein
MIWVRIHGTIFGVRSTGRAPSVAGDFESPLAQGFSILPPFIGVGVGIGIGIDSPTHFP